MKKAKRWIAMAASFVVVLTSALVLLPGMEAKAADPVPVGTNCQATYDTATDTISITKIDTEQEASIGYLNIRELFTKTHTDAKALLINQDPISFSGDNLSQLFENAAKLEKIDLSKLDTSNVTGMYSMFEGCKALAELNLSGFDTSKVTDMHNMFDSCEGLTNLDLSGFVTSNVTDMSYMFNDCCNLTALDISSFNTSAVTDMSGMFRLCSKLTSFHLSDFDTAEVTDMSNMFNACNALTTIEVSKYFVTDNVGSSVNMFQGCSQLVGGAGTTYNASYVDKSGACVDTDKEGTWGVDKGYFTLVPDEQAAFGTNCLATYDKTKKIISITKADRDKDASFAIVDLQNLFQVKWTDAKVVEIKQDIIQLDNTDLTNMFANSSLVKVDLSALDTSGVTDMSNLFYNCSSLTTVDLAGFKTSDVTHMVGMFSGCSSLTTLDLAAFNTFKVTDMYGMFQNCSSLTTISVSRQFSTTAVTDSRKMFENCTQLVGGAGTTYDSNHVDKSGACIDYTGGTQWGINRGYLTSAENEFSVAFPVNQLAYTIYKEDGTTAVEASEFMAKGDAFVVKPNSGYEFTGSNWDNVVSFSSAIVVPNVKSEPLSGGGCKYTFTTLESDCTAAVNADYFMNLTTYRNGKKANLAAEKTNAQTYVSGLGLTDPSTYLRNLDTVLAAGNVNIDDANTIAAIDAAYNTAVADMKGIQDDAFAAYKIQKCDELEAYGNTAKTEISSLNISDAEKDALRNEVDEQVTIGKRLIDQKTNKTDVDSAFQTAEDHIDDVKEKGELVEYKADKELKLEAYGAEAKVYINDLDLPVGSKTVLIAQINTAVESGCNAIDAALDKSEVDTAIAAAKTTIDNIKAMADLTVYKEQKNAQLTAAGQTAKDAITAIGLPSGTQTALLADIDAAVTDGSGNISGAQDQAAVDAAYQAAIEEINKASQEARDAFNDYQDKAIANVETLQSSAAVSIKGTDIPAVEKDALIAAVDEIADNAKEEIRLAKTTAEVDAAYNETKKQIDEIVAAARDFKIYTFKEGADSRWVKNQDDTVTITADAPFEKFFRVLVDDKFVDPSNYTVVKGSTKLTFTKNYLNSLSVGTHSVTMLWTNGMATTTLTVVEPTSGTGDATNMTLWIVLMAIAAAGAVGGVLVFKKGRKAGR